MADSMQPPAGNDDALDALMAAAADPELGAALGGAWQVVTLTRNADRSITVDVDGVAADVPPEDAGASPSVPPPPPAA